MLLQKLLNIITLPNGKAKFPTEQMFNGTIQQVTGLKKDFKNLTIIILNELFISSWTATITDNT